MTGRIRRKEHSVIAVWLIAGVLAFSAAAPATPASGKKGSYTMTLESFEFAPGRAPMLTAIYEPPAGAEAKPHPLILALHYGGPVTPETGREFAEMLVLPALKELGAVILAPNCPGRGWTDPLSEDALLKLVAAMRKTRVIDERRVAVTGFSMGAVGAYRLAARHPELFSAAVPVAGVPDPEDLEVAGRVPLFIIHGESDEVFPMDEAGPAFKILRKGPAAVRVVIVPGLSHYQTGAYVPALRKAVAWLKKIWRSRGMAAPTFPVLDGFMFKEVAS